MHLIGFFNYTKGARKQWVTLLSMEVPMDEYNLVVSSKGDSFGEDTTKDERSQINIERRHGKCNTAKSSPTQRDPENITCEGTTIP